MIDELDRLSGSDLYPFHMPGHKRQRTGTWLDEAYIHDITEIDDFDDLQEPEGVIAETEKKLADYYGADRAFISVNGSTCGNLSTISALVPHGGSFMMDRNSHKSVYNASCLGEYRISFLERETIRENKLTACISLDMVKLKLSQAKKDNDLPKAVLVTSPTYEGFIADTDGIADAVHAYGIPLILDSAHGAHLPVSKKADIAVISLHKTLPAMTQVSAVLVNGSLVKPDEVKRYINIFQTTSPSYVLMASAENCLNIMNDKGQKLKKTLEERLDGVYSLNESLRSLHITGPEHIGRYGIYDFDRSKINIIDRTGKMDGRKIYDIFRNEYHLQPERHTERTCLMMSGVMDTEEGFTRLRQAITDIDKKL
ncbi:MAG: aminotransferase class I/II-fold pyridoxal phosphate-dependent enzyme [Lachnospiraceae bacterium]|nr:aminotransferase class I/II-fold pyridoxal phosphate-dependent enzyme [Lachnospiraceae bacterium]